MCLNPFATMTLIDCIEDMQNFAKEYGLYIHACNKQQIRDGSFNYNSDYEVRYYIEERHFKEHSGLYFFSVDFKIHDGMKYPFRIAWANESKINEFGCVEGINCHSTLRSGGPFTKFSKMFWKYDFWLLKRRFKNLIEKSAAFAKLMRMYEIQQSAKEFE